jgi:hypothetical protein
MTEAERSKGHVMWLWGSEWFVREDGRLYRAPADYPVGADGYRQGARFECQPWQVATWVSMRLEDERRFAAADGREPEPDARVPNPDSGSA